MTRKNVNPPELRKSVGRRLKQARIEAGISQVELGEMLGITHGAIGFYERGHRCMSLQLTLKLAKILKKPLAYFLEDDPRVKELENIEQTRVEEQKNNYDLLGNLEFALEMSIRNYLKSQGVSDDMNEKVDNVLQYIQAQTQRA